MPRSGPRLLKKSNASCLNTWRHQGSLAHEEPDRRDQHFCLDWPHHEIATGLGAIVPRRAGYSTRPECFVRMDRAS